MKGVPAGRSLLQAGEMFTGIVECTGTVVEIYEDSNVGLRIKVQSPISKHLRRGQSVAHDGVCLTVVSVSGDSHEVNVIQPTLEKTTIKYWRKGYRVNLERALSVNGRLEGHIVQGHVDRVLTCVDRSINSGTIYLTFEVPAGDMHLIVPEGSIALNGVSLTICDVDDQHRVFTVGIIPHTASVTNLGRVGPGDPVNAEYDIIGRYLLRFYTLMTRKTRE